MKAFTNISPNGHSARDFLVHTVTVVASLRVTSVVETLFDKAFDDASTSIRSDQRRLIAVVFLEPSPLDDEDHTQFSAAAVYLELTT